MRFKLTGKLAASLACAMAVVAIERVAFAETNPYPNCPSGTFPNPPDRCYPCLGCHPCPPPQGTYCDNNTNAIVKAVPALSSQPRLLLIFGLAGIAIVLFPRCASWVRRIGGRHGSD